MPGSTPAPSHIRCAGTFLIAALAIAGCGGPAADYSKVTLVPVTGSVTLDGNPLSGAVITFEDEVGQFSYALTDDSGRYVLRFDSVMPGATPGPKIVRISTSRRIPGLNDAGPGRETGEDATESETDGAQPPVRSERVPRRYNRDSELRVDVNRGSATHDFDLVTPS